MRAFLNVSLQMSESPLCSPKCLVRLLHSSIAPPAMDSWHAAGYDLEMPEDYIVKKEEILNVPLGLSLQIPEGYYGRLAARSSAASLGLCVLGGVIDADYRGEISATVALLGKKNDLMLKKGKKYFQLILEPYLKAEMCPVDVMNDTVRRVTRDLRRKRVYERRQHHSSHCSCESGGEEVESDSAMEEREDASSIAGPTSDPTVVMTILDE